MCVTTVAKFEPPSGTVDGDAVAGSEPDGRGGAGHDQRGGRRRERSHRVPRILCEHLLYQYSTPKRMWNILLANTPFPTRKTNIFHLTSPPQNEVSTRFPVFPWNRLSSFPFTSLPLMLTGKKKIYSFLFFSSFFFSLLGVKKLQTEKV